MTGSLGVDRLGSGSGSSREVVPAPRRRLLRRLAIPAGLAIATIVLLAFGARGAWRRVPEVAVVPVVERAAPAGSGASASRARVIAPGWIEPAPHAWGVAALEPGVVREVLVLEGARVAAGETIVALVDDDARLEVAGAAARLRRAEAGVALAEADVAAALVDLEQLVAPRQRVATAAAVREELRAERALLAAQRATEEARLAELDEELARKRPLLEVEAVAAGEIARLERRLEAQASVVAAFGPRDEALAARHRAAEAEVAAAESALELLVAERRAAARATAQRDLARAEVADAERGLARATLALDRMRVLSPIDGVVMERLVAPGDRIAAAGGPVATIYDPARLQVRTDVPIADAGRVAVGDAAEIEVEVLPGRTFRGRVVRFVHRADVAKNTVEAKVAIEDPDAALMPDMVARVRLLGSGAEGGAPESRAAGAAGGARRLLAPFEGLRDVDGAQPWALVAMPEAGDRVTLERREVALGAGAIDGWVEVVAGLHPGDRLVVGAAPPAGSIARIAVAAAPGAEAGR